MYRWLSRVVLVLAFQATATAAPGPAEGNAALRYWMAFASMENPPADESTARLLEAVARGEAPWDERLSPILDANREALLQMQRGTRLPACDWGLDFDRGIETPVAHVARARSLARLNLLEGRRLAARGKPSAAVETWLAGVRFSRDLATDGTLLGALVGASSLTSHLQSLADLLGEQPLDDATAGRVERGVRQVPAYGLDWSLVLRGEENLDRWLEELAVAPADQARARLIEAGVSPEQVPSAMSLKAALTQARREHGALLERVRSAYRRPYVEARGELATLTNEVHALSPLAARFTFAFDRPNDARAELEARRALLIALVGLRRQPAASLESLGVPRDPFSGQALRVTRQGTGVEVASAGRTRGGLPIVGRLRR